MKTQLPILFKHDHKRPIGVVLFDNGAVKFKFSEEVKVSLDQAFEIFGGAGIKVTSKELVDGVVIIKEGEILEFSFSPNTSGITQKDLNSIPEMDKPVALWQEEDQPTSVTDLDGVAWMIGKYEGVTYKRRIS